MNVADIRLYVFGRERNLCRICRIRPADSMHELKFKSQGGKVSKRNSVAVCGDGVNGCHGLAQRHEIEWYGDGMGAESTLFFQACTQAAADQMRVTLHHWIESPIMAETETSA